MNTQKPLSAQLAAIFGLSPGAGETEIVATATAWAGERKRQKNAHNLIPLLARLMHHFKRLILNNALI